MKQQIIQIATQLFIEIGYKSTTMDDICNKLGISKKTLYNYYKNKTELVEDCVFHFHDIIQREIKSVLEKEYNPILEFYHVKDHLSKKIGVYQASKSYYELKKYYPTIHKKLLEQYFKTFKTNITKNLKRGIEQGYFRKNINVDFVMRFYFLILTEIDEHSSVMKKLYSQNQIDLHTLEYHIRAIATSKGIAFLEDYFNNKINQN